MRISAYLAESIWLNMLDTPQVIALKCEPDLRQKNQQALYRARRRLVERNPDLEPRLRAEVSQVPDGLIIEPTHTGTQSDDDYLQQMGLKPMDRDSIPAAQPASQMNDFLKALSVTADEEEEEAPEPDFMSIVYGTSPDENKG